MNNCPHGLKTVFVHRKENHKEQNYELTIQLQLEKSVKVEEMEIQACSLELQ